MGRVSLPPPVCDTNLSQRLSFESSSNNNNNLREASFSSYLNHAEKEFVRKLAESTRDRSNSAVTTTTQEEDGDIEVFGAEKYFNGGIESPNPLKLRPRKNQQRILHSKKPKTSSRIRSGTPSVRSESSWNSQNALLQNHVKRNSSSKGTKKNKSSQLAKGFLYKCYCCDKKSVPVDTKSKPKQKQPATKSGINFTFQSSIPAAAKNSASALKMQIQVEEQQGRKSIEVFGSSLIGKPPNIDTLNLNHLERRLSMMTWNDIVPRVKDSSSNSNSIMSIANNSNLINNDDDESDASSDLFEIESLTGNSNSFLTRQGSSCKDCVTPTTCYAPSEASIEWSVITASAADFSAVSDYDERRISTTSPVRNITTAAAYMIKSSYGNDVKEIPRRRSNNLLMGCKNQKAVRVAGDAYGSQAEVHRRSESFGRLTRFEAETKNMGFGSNQRLATNSLPRQYSPKISNILYV